MYLAFLLKNFISIDVRHFYPFFPRAQISLPYKIMGRTSVLYTFILENFRTPSSPACGATCSDEQGSEDRVRAV
jgi:hypothetical protein